MRMELRSIFEKIQSDVDSLNISDDVFDSNFQRDRSIELQKIVDWHINGLTTIDQQRIIHEFFGLGPLQELIENQSLTELIVCSHDNIWYEKNGQLYKHHDHFFTPLSYSNCLHRIQEKIRKSITLDRPFCDSNFENFRVSIVDSSICTSENLLHFRRKPMTHWNLDHLHKLNWCESFDLQFLRNIVQTRKNFLVVGTTGSGKTTIVNALLAETGENCRNIIIEDTEEIILSNKISSRLLTSTIKNQDGLFVDQSELVRRALRLRPDRLILGEIRGVEAKDFLMALSTGHQGSFGTIHANNPLQALTRLEMLTQMGAPQWSLQSIRQLIQLSLEYILMTEKKPCGSRSLKGIYRIHSLEENGFTIEPVENV